MLVALMAIGSVVMWLGVPLGLIYAASGSPTRRTRAWAPYLLVLIGLPVGMAIVGKGLGALNRAHIRLTGARSTSTARAGRARCAASARSTAAAACSTA